MRICRFKHQGIAHFGWYQDDYVIPWTRAALAVQSAVPKGDSLLAFLPGGTQYPALQALEVQVQRLLGNQLPDCRQPVSEVQFEVPIPNPSKLLLLAGNYSKHIEEGGGKAEERAKTFPYVFMKPPLTTLTPHGAPIRIPAVSPEHVDWEIELGVIIGRRCQHVTAADALDYVAGYTVVNDISDRKFKPNPERNTREKDTFFDWLHGKWHDTFCPMGPCVLPADECADPQQLPLRLTVNGNVEQEASTAEMVFNVGQIIEFISSFVTLEPGDIISTGTPHGVGHAKGKFLKAGDIVEATITGIGTLRNPVQ